MLLKKKSSLYSTKHTGKILVIIYSVHKLIDITEKEPAFDGKWFFGKSNWGKIGQSQKDQLISHMQEVYNQGIKTNPAGVETAKKFSWKNTAENLLRCMS